MKIKIIPSNWLKNVGLRLDCGPYMTGAKEAEEIINNCKLPKNILQDLLLGGSKGAFHAGREARIWVEEPEYGVRFMGSVDILQARLTNLSLMSKSQVDQKPLFKVHKNWVLITRSGTIGRMTLARDEMEGNACSEHVMRVVPDESLVKPGFLYCYLRSKFGVPLVVSSTYGAIIQHIEPHHILNLPVPKIAGEIEQKVHELVELCGQNRTQANKLLEQAGNLINSHFDFPNKLALSHRVYTHSAASSLLLQKRMDATYHDRIAQLSDELVILAGAQLTLAELGVEALERNRMKQIFAGPEYGVPFYTSGEIFRADVTPDRYLLKTIVKDDPEWQTKEEDILIARSGQVGGIIGTGVWADKRFKNTCVSPHVLRLSVTGDTIDAGYLYAYLCCTDVGYRQLIRGAAGSSVPFLSVKDILNIKVPRLGKTEEKSIGDMVRKAGNLAAEAQFLEKKAVAFVEDAIEAAAPKH